MIARETNKGFPSEIKERKKGSNQPRFAITFASPVDVKQYNYALIYCIVALSMHEFLGIQREDFSPSTPPLSLSLTLSLSLFLLFHIFKCQLYLCGLPGLWSFDVFSSSVSGFCVCEWELISKCSFRCFFLCSSKSKIKEVILLLPIHAISISLFRFSFTVVYLWIEMQSMG